jgi:hypothetical protein
MAGASSDDGQLTAVAEPSLTLTGKAAQAPAALEPPNRNKKEEIIHHGYTCERTTVHYRDPTS